MDDKQKPNQNKKMEKKGEKKKECLTT